MKPLGTDIASKFSRDYANKQHRLTLKEIREKWISLNNSVPTGSKLTSTHSKSPQFQQKLRKDQLARQNAQILNRLTAASEGFRGTAVQLRFHSTDRAGPNTLNSPLRKREAQRIQHENIQLVKRLNGRGPSVNNDRMLRDYLKHQTYKKQISKLQLIDISLKSARNPPLPRLNRTESPILKETSMRQLSVSPKGVLYRKKKKDYMFLDEDGELFVVKEKKRKSAKSNDDVVIDLNTNGMEEA